VEQQEEDKVIKIDPMVANSCRASYRLNELEEFQEDIKTLSPENAEKLGKSIIENGFNMPFFVWRELDGEDDLTSNETIHLIDGHQRKKVLEQLKGDGYILPEFFPCIKVSAKDIGEAKRKVLSFVSQMGVVDQQKLFEYMVGNDITISDLKDNFSIPDLQVFKFEDDFFNTKLEELGDPDLQGDTDSLLDADKKNDPFTQKVIIILSNEQKDIFDIAIGKAKQSENCEDEFNQDKRGNAIAAILRKYIDG